QEQPPGLRRLALEGEIAGDQAHHGRARDVDDEGAPGKARRHAARTQDVDEMAQRRAQSAADKNEDVAHLPAAPLENTERSLGVIASEAKQSSFATIRKLDCFVAIAP